MVCVIAAGNGGMSGIAAPADAFYVISVGSVTSSGTVIIVRVHHSLSCRLVLLVHEGLQQMEESSQRFVLKAHPRS